MVKPGKIQKGFRGKVVGKVPKRYMFGTEAHRNCLISGGFYGMPKREPLGKTPGESPVSTCCADALVDDSRHVLKPPRGASARAERPVVQRRRNSAHRLATLA